MNAVTEVTATTHGTPTGTPMAIEQLDKAIVGLASKIDASMSLMLQMIREFDTRAGFLQWGLSSTAEWLSWRCDLSLSAAREKVRCARALKQLPRLMSAFAQGALSYSKVRALTRVATVENEAELMEFAFQYSTTIVEERCRQLRNGAAESVADAKQAYERRALRIWRHPGQVYATIKVDVPLEEAELIANALDRAVETGAASTGPEEPSSWLAMQADALVHISKQFLARGGKDESGSRAFCNADGFQVVVHVDKTALESNEGRADLPVESVRRLSCDSSLVEIEESSAGEPLSIGRKRRVVPTAIRRALWARDKGCSFPGCTHTRYIDAHHIQHWAQGGETSIANMMLLCARHHRLVHEGGYDVRKDCSGQFLFRRPDGQAIPYAGYRRSDYVEGVQSTQSPPVEVREPLRLYKVGVNPSVRGQSQLTLCKALWPRCFVRPATG